MLDEPTRRALYDWVVRAGRGVGRDEAASGVGVSRALAAFHLDRLVAAGLLEAEYRRLTAQGVLWAAKLPVPTDGLRVELAEADYLLPAKR